MPPPLLPPVLPPEVLLPSVPPFVMSPETLQEESAQTTGVLEAAAGCSFEAALKLNYRS